MDAAVTTCGVAVAEDTRRDAPTYCQGPVALAAARRQRCSTTPALTPAKLHVPFTAVAPLKVIRWRIHPSVPGCVNTRSWGGVASPAARYSASSATDTGQAVAQSSWSVSMMEDAGPDSVSGTDPNAGTTVGEEASDVTVTSAPALVQAAPASLLRHSTRRAPAATCVKLNATRLVVCVELMETMALASPASTRDFAAGSLSGHTGAHISLAYPASTDWAPVMFSLTPSECDVTVVWLTTRLGTVTAPPVYAHGVVEPNESTVLLLLVHAYRVVPAPMAVKS